MGVKFANKTVVVGNVTVRRGDAWDASSEMVRKYPQFFDDSPTRVATGGPRHAREQTQVERATARPGEKRATPARKRAPRKRAAKKSAPAKKAAAAPSTPPTPPAGSGGGDTPPAEE